MWFEEAQWRDRKQTLAGTDNSSQVSQCLKMQDSDLDSTQPRRRRSGWDRWQAHLRNSFIKGLRPDVASLLKPTGIQWDSGKLSADRDKCFHIGQKLCLETSTLQGWWNRGGGKGGTSIFEHSTKPGGTTHTSRGWMHHTRTSHRSNRLFREEVDLAFH